MRAWTSSKGIRRLHNHKILYSRVYLIVVCGVVHNLEFHVVGGLVSRATTTTTIAVLRGRRSAPRPAFASKNQFEIDVTVRNELDSCRSRSEASRILTRALGPEANGLYDSVSIPRNLSSRPISDAELALQTRTIHKKYKLYELIEQNGDGDVDGASLAVLCTFLAGSTTAIFAERMTEIAFFGTVWVVPVIVRFILVGVLSFSPLILVGCGLAVPAELSSTLARLRRVLFPSYRKRMIQHEAGHFLVGHLLGWPVKNYRGKEGLINAVEFYPLSDDEVGYERAKALGFEVSRNANDNDRREDVEITDRPYFSKEGRGRDNLERSVFRDSSSKYASFDLPRKDDPLTSWPFRGFDEETLDKLSVISVAGACSEILAFGNSEGGMADLDQLRRIYGAASKKSNDGDIQSQTGTFDDDARRRRSNRLDGGRFGSEGMDEKEMDNRTKFALGYAMILLRSHLGALDAVADVMEGGGTVADCIVALESCRSVGDRSFTEDYEKERRDKFRSMQGGVGSWVERSFLGGGKTIDVEENGIIEGKGGGGRKRAFEVTGDDPFYAAVAVALAFLAWASSGGLRLH